MLELTYSPKNAIICLSYFYLGGCYNMERVKLVGAYSSEPMPCHFEDIPIFLKMADLGKDNSVDAIVKVCKLSLFDATSFTKEVVIPEEKQIVRWKIVQDKRGCPVLAYRVLNQSRDWHCRYIVRKDQHRRIVLCKCKDNQPRHFN